MVFLNIFRLVYKSEWWAHLGFLLFLLERGQVSSSSKMFKVRLFWAFLRIQLLGLLRTTTAFASGQASGPDVAPRALLPRQLKNCCPIYPGSDDPAPAPQSLSLHPCKAPMHLPSALGMPQHHGARPGRAPSCEEKLFTCRPRAPSAVRCRSGAEGTVPRCARFPRLLLGPAGPKHVVAARGSAACLGLVWLFADWLGGRVINLWVNTEGVWN